MKNPDKHLQKRSCQRISSNLPVKFYYGNSIFFGTARNISINGMFLHTNKVFFPLDSEFDVVIPFARDILKISARVKRVEKSGGVYNGIGVELLDMPDNYLNLISELM